MALYAHIVVFVPVFCSVVFLVALAAVTALDKRRRFSRSR